MRDRSALMGNSNFVRKIEAEYIMIPPHPTQNIYLILLAFYPIVLQVVLVIMVIMEEEQDFRRRLQS